MPTPFPPGIAEQSGSPPYSPWEVNQRPCRSRAFQIRIPDRPVRSESPCLRLSQSSLYSRSLPRTIQELRKRQNTTEFCRFQRQLSFFSFPPVHCICAVISFRYSSLPSARLCPDAKQRALSPFIFSDFYRTLF